MCVCVSDLTVPLVLRRTDAARLWVTPTRLVPSTSTIRSFTWILHTQTIYTARVKTKDTTLISLVSSLLCHCFNLLFADTFIDKSSWCSLKQRRYHCCGRAELRTHYSDSESRDGRAAQCPNTNLTLVVTETFGKKTNNNAALLSATAIKPGRNYLLTCKLMIYLIRLCDSLPLLVFSLQSRAHNAKWNVRI